MVQVSASQIELWEKCPRAWGFRYLSGIKEPEKVYRARGKRIHSVIEGFLLTGTIPKWDSFEIPPDPDEAKEAREHYELGARLVQKALDNGHLPPAGTESCVEAQIEEPVAEGIVLKGFVDLIWESDRLNIEDHKTTSSFDRNKTPAELMENVQLATYATSVLRADPTAQIRLSHVYYFTGNKIKVKTARVSVDVTPEDVAKVWDTKVIPVSRLIAGARAAAVDPMAMEARGSLNGHCEAYGGCFHREACGINKQSTQLFSMGGLEMSANPLLARLAAKSATLKVETPTPPAATVTNGNTEAVHAKFPAQITAPGDTTNPNALIARLAAGGNGTPQVHGAAAQALVPDLPTGGGLAGSGALADTVVKTVDELAALVGIVPPDGASRVDDTPAHGFGDVDLSTSPDDPEPPPVVLTAPVDVVKRKPGRPSNKVLCPACNNQTSLSGDKTIRDHAGVNAHGHPDDMAPCVGSGDTMEEAQAFQAKRVMSDTLPIPEKIQDAVDVVTAPPAVVKAAIKAKITASPPVAVPGFHLFLDTMQTRGGVPAVQFEDWIAPIMVMAAEAAGVLDYRLIEYKSAGVLAVAIRAYVQQNGLPPTMEVSSKSGQWPIAREVLLPQATQITQPKLG